jgi:Ca2+-binding EF-hand superfamily protein
MLLNSEISQTFNSIDGFKIIVLTINEKNSNNLCSWITNKSIDKSHYYYLKQYENTFFAFFPYWMDRKTEITDNCYYDAMIISVSSEEEYNKINEEIDDKYKNIPIKLVLYTGHDKFNFKDEENDFKKFLYFDSNTAPEEIIKTLISLDKELLNSLKKLFDKFDEDKSGFIELNEISQISKTLGDDTKSENFKKAVFALDLNHDERISFEEFIRWWKMKSNVTALSKIYELNVVVNEIVYGVWHYVNMKKEFIKLDQNLNTIRNKFNIRNNLDTCNFGKNDFSVTINTNDDFKIKSIIKGRLSIGGYEHIQAAKNYLSKFSDDMDLANSDWFSIGIFLKADTITGEEAASLLLSFREKLIEYVENKLGLSSFIKNFLTFEIKSYDYSVNLIIRLKIDIKSLIYYAIENIIEIKNWICNKNAYGGKHGFEFEFNIMSDKEVEILSKNYNNDSGTVGEFLKNSEININGYCDKNRLKILAQNLTEEYQEYISIIKLLFLSNNLKINDSRNIETIFDRYSINKEYLDKKLNFILPLFEFLKTNLEKKLYESFSRVEFSFNLFEIFGNLQFYSGCFHAK